MDRPLRIGITSGDADGIGPEVVAKALHKLGPQKGVQFVLWRNSDFPKRDLARLKKSFKLVTVSDWAEALQKIPSSSKSILDIKSNAGPARWVEEAASACLYKHIEAMATAPLSKPAIANSGLRDIGHTDILKRITKTDKAYMTFIGEKFNVMLATGHIPLSDVSNKLTLDVILKAAHAANDFAIQLAKLTKSKRSLGKKPLGLLGLNPHAGDSGLIGGEDDLVLKPALEALHKDGILAEGPLVPDSAFTPASWSRYSLYLALYHDQGLIPFKTVHGHDGVHLTWGLPFVRTSVDHGTAFDIAGKDKANATSMRLAIEWAIKLARGLAT